MKKIILGIVALVIIIVILVANQKPAEKPILGVITPLSGPAGSIGEEVQRSIMVASSTHMTVLYEDDQCDTKKAISAYKLLKQKGAKYFYLACSGSVMAVAPLAKADGNLIITAYAGSSEIRKTGTEVIELK